MNGEPQHGPTALAKVLIFLIIGASLAGAAYFFKDTLFPGGGHRDIDVAKFRDQQGQIPAGGSEAFHAGVVKTVRHAPGLYGVRRQAKRDAALA